MYLVPLSRTVKYGDNNMFFVTFTTVKNVLFKKIKRAQRTEPATQKQSELGGQSSLDSA